MMLVNDIAHIQQVVNRLNDQRKEGQFCDVVLRVAGQTVPIHSCVLSAGSPFFRKLIGQVSSDPQSRAPLEIDLTMPVLVKGDLQTLIDIVDYIYTGKIEIKEESISSMVKMAEAFMLHGLATLLKKQRNVMSSSENSPEIPVVSTEVTVSAIVSDANIKNVSIDEKNVRRSKRVAVSKSNSQDQEMPVPKKSLPATDSAAITKPNDGIEPKVPEAKSTVRTYRYRCKQCKWSSRDMVAVRQHKLLHGGRNFVCLTCGFFTGVCPRLLHHLLIADHLGETRCSLCEFVATDAEGFRLHLQRHGEVTQKPFFCENCPRRFQYASSLHYHVVTHESEGHGVVVEKKYACHCGYRTAYKYNLRQHQRRHKEEQFRCPEEGCLYSSYLKQNVKMHMTKHTKEKAFQCEICGSQFTQRSTLKKHAKNHNKDAHLIRCERCKYASISLSNFKRHMMQVHQIRVPKKAKRDASLFAETAIPIEDLDISE